MPGEPGTTRVPPHDSSAAMFTSAAYVSPATNESDGLFGKPTLLLSWQLMQAVSKIACTSARVAPWPPVPVPVPVPELALALDVPVPDEALVLPVALVPEVEAALVVPAAVVEAALVEAALVEAPDELDDPGLPVERASSKLVKEGQLKYVEPKKGGHWEVLENSK